MGMGNDFFTRTIFYGLAGGIWIASGTVSHGQIVPDSSLGTTVRVRPGGEQLLINGGVERGDILFHSLQEFNIAPEETAYFVNPPATELILTRVTGDNTSNLLGRLGVLGTADLFLINPNGFVFGPQSSLDMGGSFIASTASGVVFGDEFIFSATTLDRPPMLTVNVPSGLQFGQQPSPILYQDGVDTPSQGLRVEPGRTLALVGGALNFQRATLEATRGRIELGSVAGAGQVSVLPQGAGWTFDYSDILAFDNLTATRSSITTTTESRNRLVTSNEQDGDIVIQAADIFLDDATLIQAGTFTDIPSGDITINAQRLTMEDGALLSTRALTNSIENIQGSAGNIFINADEFVSLRGGLTLGNSILSTGIDTTVRGEQENSRGISSGIVFGDGGDIVINAQQLFVTEGAQIKATSRTAGDAGDVTVNASELVAIADLFQSNNRVRRGGISGATTGSGAGGDLVVNTGELRILDGAGLTVEASGTGDGGSVTVNADVVSLIGSATPPGKATLRSAVLARTDGAGDAGRIDINTRVLEVRNGGQVSTTAQAGSRGNSNLIRVNAAESILVDGGVMTRTGFSPSGLVSNAVGTGNAGLLQLDTGELRISNGGRVSASTLNRNAQSSGGLDLTVNRLFLDNGGQIVVGTLADEGSGAEIAIADFTLVLLRNGSLITAEALNSANGGNIRFESVNGFVVAPLDEDSDIIARANFGNGGEIEIVAQSILGLEERPALDGNGTNDIDAGSRFGEAGTVSLSELGTDPTQGVTALPDTVGTPEISQRCNAEVGVSRFVTTGRGGIPSETSAATLLWETLEQTESAMVVDDGITQPSAAPLMEAQGWAVDTAGNVVLTATSTGTPPYVQIAEAYCRLTPQ